MSDNSVKHDVGQFYNEVGWQMEEKGLYQNARYEDLRPVSADYIQNATCASKTFGCKRSYLLDAGSGPVQYDEYLTYSEDYRARVCMIYRSGNAGRRKRLAKAFMLWAILLTCLSKMSF